MNAEYGIGGMRNRLACTLRNSAFRILHSVLLLLLFKSVAVAQSPFVRSQAGFYVDLQSQFTPAYHRAFDDSGQRVELPRSVAQNTWRLSGEYGFNRRLTGILALPWGTARRGNVNPNYSPTPPTALTSGRLSGLGNVTLGLRRSLRQGRFQWSGTLLVDLPSPRSNQDLGLRNGLNAFTLQPVLSVGEGRLRSYWFAFAGVGLRTHSYNHFATGGLEGGIYRNNWKFSARADVLRAFRNQSHPPLTDATLTGLFHNNQSGLATALQVGYRFNRFTGLIANVRTLWWGENVTPQPTVGLGLYFRWD